MDTIYRLIEVYAGKLSNWAWDRRWKYKDQEKWLKGYREWKKRKCPHNQPTLRVFSMEKAPCLATGKEERIERTPLGSFAVK